MFSVTSDGVAILVGIVVGKLDAVVFNTFVVAAVEDVLGSIVVCSWFDDVVFVASKVVVFVASAVVVFMASEFVVFVTSEVVVFVASEFVVFVASEVVVFVASEVVVFVASEIN